MDNKISYGFDSCSTLKFLSSVKNDPNYKMYSVLADSCESTLFSLYINVNGKCFIISKKIEKTSIPLTKEIRDKLKKLRIIKLETYNEILIRLMKDSVELKELKKDR